MMANVFRNVWAGLSHFFGQMGWFNATLAILIGVAFGIISIIAGNVL